MTRREPKVELTGGPRKRRPVRDLDAWFAWLTERGCGLGERQGHNVFFHCPLHLDGDPSLAVSSKAGTVVVYCHGGCGRCMIKVRDWLESDAQRDTSDDHSSRSTAKRFRAGGVPTDVYEGYWTYHEANGTEVARKHKYRDPATGKKQCPWQRIAPGGMPTWGLKDSQPVPPLYGLHTLAKRAESVDRVWIVEGEKDVDRLATLGLVATCPSRGSTWPFERSDEAVRLLVEIGLPVTVIADRDDVGEKLAREIVADLRAVGVDATAVRTPVEGEGSDVSDHLDAGLGLDALVPLDGESEGAGLLDEVRAFVGRFVAFPTDAALDAVTLFAAHTHFVAYGDNSPRLALLSPEPGSGKTRTLEVLELLVPRPMMAVHASSAPIFRSIDAEQPTLLFDEVDAIFRGRGKDESAEDLRALLNAGHRKGASVPRCVGPQHDVKRFNVYAAVALAGLGDLPDTLMSRSVIIRMRRNHDRAPFRRRLHQETGENLQHRLGAWADKVGKIIGAAWPKMPAGITDRPADVWEPLLAIADEAGGHWPETARSACVELCKVAGDRELSLGVQLLTELRDVFEDKDAMPTKEVLFQLWKLEESPWCDIQGWRLDPRGLARRLRPYEVRSTKIRTGPTTTAQGYRREDLQVAWLAYLPLQGSA